MLGEHGSPILTLGRVQVTSARGAVCTANELFICLGGRNAGMSTHAADPRAFGLAATQILKHTRVLNN